MNTATGVEITDDFIDRLLGEAGAGHRLVETAENHATVLPDGSLGETPAYLGSVQTADNHATALPDGSLGETPAYI